MDKLRNYQEKLESSTVAAIVANPAQTRLNPPSRMDRRIAALKAQMPTRPTSPHGDPERWLPDYLQRRLYEIRHRRRSGRPFDLTADHLMEMARRQGFRCAVSGIEFHRPIPCGKAKRLPFTPSIDRIDCDGDYVQGNVRLVCLIVNLALNIFGEDALQRMSLAIVSKMGTLRTDSRSVP